MKKQFAMIVGICILGLAGCGKESDSVSTFLNTCIEDAVMELSNIESEEGYIQYEQLVQDGEVNSEGYYVSDEVDYSVLDDLDLVHVTFATNSYIDIDYYADQSLLEELDINDCYLNTNDCIYAKILEINNPNTDSYEFDCFEVWEFDEEGTKKKELETYNSEDGLVFQIPMEFTGREIAIVPLGKYVPREIELNDYYIDNNGMQQKLAGTWEVNDGNNHISTTGDGVSVSSVTSYTVTYKYNPDEFDLVSSTPANQYNNEVDGIVSFEEYSADMGIISFSVELCKKDGSQKFDPAKYKAEYAEIEYRYQGVIITEPTPIPEGGKIEYIINSVDEGYWVPGSMKGEIEVDDKISYTIENLICLDKEVTVYLPQPDKGGTITYMMDGKEIDGDKVKVKVGTEIMMAFQSKNGWSCKAEDGTVYRAIENEDQRINVEGLDVNEVFFEQDNKPNLVLIADKSINENIEFSIVTVDGEKTALKKDNPKKSKELFNGPVGTKEDLTLSLSQSTVDEGEAIKFVIEKTTKNDEKEKDIQYLTKLPSSIKIPLYINDQNTVYKSIVITASTVPVVDFECPIIDNGYITVSTTDLTNNRILKKGEVIEDSRKVEVAVVAKNGYYVKNSGKTESYMHALKYSKYQSNIDSILKEHPVKKLCKIELDESDPYGTVTFKIDGKVVETGTYSLQEEQKLEISYEITDGEHIILRNSSGIAGLWDKTKSKTKETISVPIAVSLDESKITRDMYISIVEK